MFMWQSYHIKYMSRFHFVYLIFYYHSLIHINMLNPCRNRNPHHVYLSDNKKTLSFYHILCHFIK